MRLDKVLADDGRRPESQERGHDVEGANQHHRPNHAVTCRFGVRHRVEPDQDMGQAGRTEDQSDAQRNQVQRSIWWFVTQAGGQEVFHHFLSLGVVIGYVANRVEEGAEAESKAVSYTHLTLPTK